MSGELELMAKKILIIHTQSALNNLAGKEALDLSLIFAAYDQVVEVLFIGDGVTQCLKAQQPEHVQQKDYLSTFKLLEMYEVEGTFVCQQSIEKLGIATENVSSIFSIVDGARIQQLKQQADHIMVI